MILLSGGSELRLEVTDWDTYAYDLGAHSHAARVIVMPASVFDSFSYLVCVDLSSVSVCVCARARARPICMLVLPTLCPHFLSPCIPGAV